MYVHAFPRVAYAQTAPIALFCWDAATNATCGLIDRRPSRRRANPGGSAAGARRRQDLFAGDTGRLYCVDPATNAACTRRAYLDGSRATTWAPSYDIVAHGSRVYVSRYEAERWRASTSASGRLAPAGRRPSSSRGWNIVNQHDAHGRGRRRVRRGGFTLAAVRPRRGARHDDGDARLAVDGQYYSVTQEAETGTRTLVASLHAGGLGCWDWTSMAPVHRRWLQRERLDRQRRRRCGSAVRVRRGLGRLVRGRPRRPGPRLHGRSRRLFPVHQPAQRNGATDGRSARPALRRHRRQRDAGTRSHSSTPTPQRERAQVGGRDRPRCADRRDPPEERGDRDERGHRPRRYQSRRSSGADRGCLDHERQRQPGVGRRRCAEDPCLLACRPEAGVLRDDHAE